MFPMMGSRGGPGGDGATLRELRDLAVIKIRKHDTIKQKRRNRASPEMISIIFFSTNIFFEIRESFKSYLNNLKY